MIAWCVDSRHYLGTTGHDTTNHVWRLTTEISKCIYCIYEPHISVLSINIVLIEIVGFFIMYARVEGT